MQPRHGLRRFVASFVALPAMVAACGAKSGLLDVDTVGADAGDDRGVGPADVGPRADVVSHDVVVDAIRDVEKDASFDVADVPGCADTGGTRIYLLSDVGDLFSFYPPTREFARIGPVHCPAAPGATPWSMAVDRTGVAYEIFSDGELFRVKTATATCAATSYAPDQLGFLTFGMGFAANADGSETLFVSESRFRATSKGLGRIDTSSFALAFVGAYSSEIQRAELTGTADGRLFAYSPNDPGTGSHVYEIDKTTAKILSDDALDVGGATFAYAFAFWGGRFYLFTGDASTTTVTEWDPATKTAAPFATLPATIVGAGVSTCAPL